MGLLTMRETAKRLNVSYETVRRMAASGHLPVIKYPTGSIRIDEDCLSNCLETWTCRDNGNHPDLSKDRDTGLGTSAMRAVPSALSRRIDGRLNDV